MATPNSKSQEKHGMNSHSVIPAQAGIQTDSMTGTAVAWIPAFAGMTKVCDLAAAEPRA
jgi:hypothetical protein